MNIKDIVENELTQIRENSRKYPLLCKLLDDNLLKFTPQSFLKQLLPLISASKNVKLILQGIGLIQKLQNMQLLTSNDLDIILEFFNYSKSQTDETIDIKLVSTLLHIIGPDVIDFSNFHQLIKVLNLLIQFSSTTNTIVTQSAIQGIITLSNELEDHLTTKSQETAAQTYYELLELFYQILQGKEQTHINVSQNIILCKDIFIMILKCGKPMLQLEKFHSFYFDTLYNYLLNFDLPSETNIMNKINIIRLIFNYILVVEDKYDLIHHLMNTYSRLPLFDQSKVVIHDGILCLYSNMSLFLTLLTKQPQGNEFNGKLFIYKQIIMNQFLNHYINIHFVQLKNSKINNPQNKTFQLINLLLHMQNVIYLLSLIYLFNKQIETLIQIITENTQKLSFQEESKEGLLQDFKQSRLFQSQLVNDQQDEIIQDQFIQETESDDIKFKTLFDKIWRPILRIHKQILKIASNQQYQQLLDYLYQWMKISLAQNQIPSFQLLIRFLAAQSAPQSLKYNETDKWIIACKLFSDVLLEHLNILTAKTWNLVFQTLQRIEQVVSKANEVKLTTTIFINSADYQDTTIFHMVDGLNQLALQVSERLQTSQRKTFDSIYKSFAIDKLLLIVNCNWHRIEKIWIIVQALCLCLCGSKIMEMRLNAIHTYKDIVLSGVDYFKNHTTSWNNEWGKHLFNPLSELIISQFEDVVENVLQLLQTLLKDQAKHIPIDSYFTIISLLDVALNELFAKADNYYLNGDLSQANSKSIFMRIILSVNCLSEIVFNQLDRLDKQTLSRLSKILVSMNKQEPFNYEITNKIVCMTWQVQEKLLKLEIIDQNLWEITVKLFKDCMENQDDLKYASIHILAQICLVANEQHFTELFGVFEEIISHSVEYYLKIESHQLSLIQQTPRFTTLPMETPKFQGQLKQVLFDKNTSIQLFKQQFELMKLCISRLTDIIIGKSLYSKFYYYIQLFNQAHCVYIKHEVALTCKRIILSNTDSQLIIASIDFITTLINYESTLDMEDIQYYLENKTFFVAADIIKLAIPINPKKGFQVFSLLFHFISQDSIIPLLNDENNVFLYYLRTCFDPLTCSENVRNEWLNACNDQLQSLGIVLKHHNYIEFLSNCFEALIINRELNENDLKEAHLCIGTINNFLNKCHKFMNDNSEKLQQILNIKLKSIITAIIPYLDQISIQQIFEPLIAQQLSTTNKRTQDWITFFVEDAKYLNADQQDVVVELFTNYYIGKLQSEDTQTQQIIIMNLIGFLKMDNFIIKKFANSIKIPLLDGIHQNLKIYISEEGTNNEQQFNIQVMLDYLNNLEKEELREFYLTLVDMIKCESVEIRIKLITLLSKFF